MGQIQSLDEFLDLLRRRWRLIGLILVIGTALSLMIAVNLPRTYVATAVIQVESPMVAGANDATAGSRSAQTLQAIEQRLTTRDNMLAVIERHRLFADLPQPTPTQKVALLRNSVQFQSVASVEQPTYGGTASVSALVVSVTFGSADQAARVANDFAQNILDASTFGQTERARETLRFFVDAEQRVTQEITTLEDEIAAFMNANADALPSADATRRDEAISLETEMRALDQSLVALVGERKAIEKKELLRETDRRQIEVLTGRITLVTQQKDALSARRAELAAAIARTPEVDRTLAGYDRRQQQLQSQYDVITTRLAEAETNLRLEDLQHGEHFSLLERALTPEFPQTGGGKKIAALGGMISLFLALGLAFVLDMLNPVLRNSRQMERQLNLRPVISIPEIKATNPKRWLGLPRYAVLAGLVLLVFVVAAAGFA
ncbi:MAG: Wzz/FepE/Etk N-terminal domain-containing protein [Paracoccaceae bacterium]|nr:Wzz/FepE/Etk N-terminal domain-containing protein [Paracoccaceae bacterium]